MDLQKRSALLLCILSLLLLEARHLLAASETAPNGPRIFISPNDPVFTIDSSNPSSKVLTCQTTGDKPSMFSQPKWSGPNRNDNYLELAQRHKVYEEDTNSMVLEFVKPTPDDSGVYSCRSTYQESDNLNASITVKVYTPIKLENCADRQFLVEGATDGRINCRITGDLPRITMYKNNASIDSFANRYKGDNDGGLLINGAVTKADAGIYAIRVKSSVTGELKNHFISVEVHSRPEILTIDNNSALAGLFAGVESEQAQLECKVTGFPKPLVYWLDPKLRNLTSLGGYIVNQEKGTLQINRVNRLEDHGEFTCVAYNTISTTSRKVSMTVQTKPSILAFDNKTVDEGSEVTFECRSSGNPQPTFEIRKAGNNQLPYKPGDGFVRDVDTVSEGGGSDVFVYRLKIVANKSNFGLHYCRAYNKAGSAERPALLAVNHRPDLSKTPAEQFVKLGQKFTVTCHIKAFPEPRVTWFSDNTQIVNVDSSMQSNQDGDIHVVTMMPPSVQQTAFNRYTCVAENKMGKSEQMIIPRYTTKPGVVSAELVDRKPTTLKVRLNVPNDGGDRIRSFKYRAEGKTLDVSYPYYSYKDDRHNETIISTPYSPSSVYTIRNLFPYYHYRITFSAINDVGEGDSTDFSVETTKPTAPEPPIIINSGLSTNPGSDTPSEYSNAYLLKWSPPESDNGDPVTKFVIKCYRIISDSLVSDSSLVEERVVEQMNERPMHAKLGPLETNSRYKILIQARNKIGDSEPAQTIVRVSSDRPLMQDLEAQSLAWLGQTSTPTLVIVVVAVLVLLTIIEVIFSVVFQIGITRYLFCSSKEHYNAEV